LSVNGSTGAVANVAKTNVDNNFTASQTIEASGAILSVVDSGSLSSFELEPGVGISVSDSVNSPQTLEFNQNIFPSTVTLPNFTTTLAGLAGTQTFTGTNTFSSLANFNGGISSAGGTFSALTRFTAGISAAGATFTGNITLQNEETIRNTTNGRIDFMPGPVSGTTYGLYMHFTNWGNGAFGPQFGVINSSTGVLDTSASILYGTDLVMTSAKAFSLNSAQTCKFRVNSSATGRVHTLNVTVPVGTGYTGAAFALIDSSAAGNANRAPVVNHSHPNFYVYSAGSANANDFIRIEHDRTNANIVTGQTSGILMQPGSGWLGVSGGISASGGATFTGDIAVNGGDITTTASTATLFNNTTNLDILNTQTSGFTLNIGNATSFSGIKRVNIGGNLSGGASSEIVIGSSSSSSKVSILGGITLGGGVGGNVVRVSDQTPLIVDSSATFNGNVDLGDSASDIITVNGLLTANAGISASGGITFNSDVSVNSANTLNVSTIRTISGKAQLDIDNRANARVAIGDYDEAGLGTNIFLRDDTRTLQIANPYGVIEIGDPQGFDTGNYIYYAADEGTLHGNGSNINDFNTIENITNLYSVNIFGTNIFASAGISSAGGTFSALTRFTAGISAAGGMTLNGTLNFDGNIELKKPSNTTTTIQAYYSPAPGFYSPTSFISLSPLNGITFGGGIVNVPGYLNVDISSRFATEGIVPLKVKGTVTPFTQLVNMTDWIDGNGTIISSILVDGGFSGPASNFSGLITANGGISASNPVTINNVTASTAARSWFL